MTESDLFKQNIQYHSEEKETTICMEECAELIQAISKCKRYGCNNEYRDNLIEEIADVSIIIDELKLIYHIDYQDISSIRQKKIARMLKRIKNNL